MKRGYLIAALAAAVVAGGAAVAVAQTSGGPEAERQAFLDDAAGRLGVESQELEDALTEAALARVDAAVDAGRLTEEQAERMREHIRAGGAGFHGLGRGGPGMHGGGHGFMHGGGPGGLHRGGHGFLEPAAAYLGLGEAELRDRLAGGDTLADVAEAEGKDAGGLVDALVEAKRAHLDRAVDSGRLDAAARDAVLERMREHVEALVRGERPAGWHHGGRGGGHGW